VNDLLAWLEGTGLATWVRESPSIWAYPAVLTLHTVGLGIVVGASAVLDLRLLGFARGIRIPSLSPLFRVILWAVLLNATTGVMLFMADATTKAKQPIFGIKLMLIALALGVTVRIRGVVRRSSEAPDPASHPVALALSSMVLWAAAITAGRLMAYM
jgi:hypothetical protein